MGVTTSCFAAEDLNLSPLIKEGAAGEVLQQDLILPAEAGSVDQPSSTGSIVSAIQDRAALPVSNYGRPGALSQVRGFGLSAEDVDVQAFGVSLNSPQGGGFDLSVFPSFLWSGFSFQSGPSLNGLNPTSSAGTLSLTPWTAEALKNPEGELRLGGGYATSGMDQVFASGKSQSDLAWVVGYSGIRSIGPSAGLSSQWRRGSAYYGALHLLATDLDAEAQGSTDAPTPMARMHTTRVIPVLESYVQLSDVSRYRSSLFFDGSRLAYSNPASQWSSESVVNQWGMENVLEAQDWKVGLNLRRVSYAGSGFQAPLQWIGNLQVSRTFGKGDWMFIPTFQGAWVNGFGWLPQGTVGVRKEWDRGSRAVFFRAGTVNKIPTLLDRYYIDPQFIGNPDLQTEQSWNATLGTESKGAQSALLFQVYGQLRTHARVLVPSGQGTLTVNNLGDAALLAIQNRLKFQLSPDWTLSHSFSWSTSQIQVTGQSFPLIPSFLEVLGVESDGRLFGTTAQWTTVFRFSGPYGIKATTSDLLPGYMAIDSSVVWELFKRVHLTTRVENLLNQTIQYVSGYPTGRIISILATGHF